MDARQPHDDTGSTAVTTPARSHRLRFASLHDPGRGVVIPCDASGQVDIDGLGDRMRIAYLAARAMLGREYAYPVVERLH